MCELLTINEQRVKPMYVAISVHGRMLTAERQIGSTIERLIRFDDWDEFNSMLTELVTFLSHPNQDQYAWIDDPLHPLHAIVPVRISVEIEPLALHEQRYFTITKG
jgi:hypothetical protein